MEGKDTEGNKGNGGNKGKEEEGGRVGKTGGSSASLPLGGWTLLSDIVR